MEFCYAPFDIKKVKMKSLHPVHLPNRPRKSVGWSLVFERKSQIGLCFLLWEMIEDALQSEIFGLKYH